LSQAQKLNSKLDGLTEKNGRRIRCDATLRYFSTTDFAPFS
jgi:hypothetical protein